MINNGSFEDMEFCIMVHLFPADVMKPLILSEQDLIVTYKVQASHAAAFSWKEKNALDATVMAYSNTSVFRQQLKPLNMFMVSLKKVDLNLHRAQVMFNVRGPSDEELNIVAEKA